MGIVASGADTYVWNTGVSTDFIQDTPSATITYSVTGTNAIGCTGAATITVTVIDCSNGISEASSSANVLIVPNPTSGVFTIQSDVIISKIEIVNLLGEKIYEAPINAARSLIDLSPHPQGIYFIHLTTSKGMAVKKIMKE